MLMTLAAPLLPPVRGRSAVVSGAAATRWASRVGSGGGAVEINFKGLSGSDKIQNVVMQAVFEGKLLQKSLQDTHEIVPL